MSGWTELNEALFLSWGQKSLVSKGSISISEIPNKTGKYVGTTQRMWDRN